MTGNGLKFIPPIKMVIWGMVYYCFTNIIRNPLSEHYTGWLIGIPLLDC